MKKADKKPLRRQLFPSLGWQQLFIVSAIGVALIIVGVGFQLLQLFVSIRQRHANRDLTGDPWDGRTLEWSTTSPPPAYNFATMPAVSDRDAFWAMKQNKHKVAKPHYEPIKLPKNTPLGMLIAGLAFMGAFGFIWHIYYLPILSLIGIIFCVVLRAFDPHTERTISVAEIEGTEKTAKEVYG